ncbi:TonB-dependent receptor [Saccharophagus degradans]|uniref:TonB-dependent receptor n=1 Tax=Saccharophagus degradans TaxID=86304 RepID=UPI001C087C94|nr:TonB-dependent receptor [Saccharophagus degradans]MBU2985647.1 TonB-dependent receptor [Saccharophagus degradans]
MKYLYLTAAAMAVSINTHALQGKVVDSKGSPVANATIQVVGSSETFAVNKLGEFSIDETQAYEIHIVAPGFSHKVIRIGDTLNTEPMQISLTRSVIEQVDVIGLPIHASVIESAQPISVLSGNELRNRQAATLGDSLEGEVGVHTNFHGNVASTPIIRGLSGPRVQITQNSMDVSDVSRVGPDHAVASEVSTAEQVEILRGPATLFFGSGAIGGVVNVVDTRVPKDSTTYGEWFISHETVNKQKLGAVNINTGLDAIALHFDGFWRESSDYQVPVNPETNTDDQSDSQQTDHLHNYFVSNSSEESHGFTLGSSYLLDNGYVGASYGKLYRQYGIPGHSHGGEQHNANEVSVFAELDQDRFQVISEIDLNSKWLTGVNSRLGYTNYSHAEIEAGFTGTIFTNKTLEAKVDLMHQPIQEWKGGWVFHYKHSDVSAVGQEAFTPPSNTASYALAAVEEKHIGNVLLQLGMRVEHVSLKADNVLLPELNLHSHSEQNNTHSEEHEDTLAIIQVFETDQSFSLVSISAGAVWDFTPGYNLAISLAHAERAPHASELLSFGPHIGTGSYEIGALFELNNTSSEPQFDINRSTIQLETSNNIDLTFRKYEGEVGVILNAFYNQVDNYYYQTTTGLYAQSGHNHAHGDDEAHDVHDDELPVYLFKSADAQLYGFEAQSMWQVTPRLKTTLFSDYVQAKLREDSTYLPRTPPLRYGAKLDYQYGSITANISWSHFNDQTHVAPLETKTRGYDWLDASASWSLPIKTTEVALFIKAENITDTEARVHTSYLKNIAPKSGRNFSVGLRGNF